MGRDSVEPPTILAVTFTKKATREMQERVNKLIPAVSNKHKPLIATVLSSSQGIYNGPADQILCSD
ncbi:MAG: UvrD-helicase domain-containing protein [Endomicrobium sp.]|nr:UvrD-helicase domain-containing protein [Endomicrobium sp.]